MQDERTTRVERISFGPFVLDVSASRLFRDGIEIRLRHQAIDALKVLVDRIGHHVNYAELIREAWGGNIVSLHTVATTIGAIRKALSEYGSWITYRPKLGYRLEIPGVDEMLRTGWHLWNRRTREGVERALACFEQVAQQNPLQYGALEGITTCYMSLGTGGMRAPNEMYEAYQEALEKAVALRGWTPTLRADHARFVYVFDRKFEQAESELRMAEAGMPPPVTAFIYKAILYASRKRFSEALEAYSRAKTLDPLWPTIPSTEIFVHFCRREFDTAVECGKRALDLHPYLHLGRSHYAQALEFSGRPEEALNQYRLGSVIAPDMLWLKALEARCLANLGRRDQALRLLDELNRIRLSEYVDPYYMSLLLEALGQRAEAFAELERILEENSPSVYMIDVDPKMDSLRGDRRFAKLRQKLLGSS